MPNSTLAPVSSSYCLVMVPQGYNWFWAHSKRKWPNSFLNLDFLNFVCVGGRLLFKVGPPPLGGGWVGGSGRRVGNIFWTPIFWVSRDPPPGGGVPRPPLGGSRTAPPGFKKKPVSQMLPDSPHNYFHCNGPIGSCK